MLKFKREKNLVKDLSNLLGKNSVLSEPEEIIAYSSDTITSDVQNKNADIIVFPKSSNEIQEIVKYAKKWNVPVIPRGAGTNLCGACLAIEGGIVMSFSKMNKILEINPQNMYVKVQPGVVILDLVKEVEKFGLYFPVDPSNLAVSTIGGAIALSSGGPKTFKWGSIKDYVLDLEVVLANSEITHTGKKTTKNVTGYNLTQLFVGSEGTLGIVSEATLKLVPKPEMTKLMLAYFSKIEDGANAVCTTILNRVVPSVMDIMDNNTLKTINDFYPANFLTQYECALLIELEGNKFDIDNQQKIITKIFNDYNCACLQIANNEQEAEKIWTSRRSAYGACIKIAPDILTEDIVVPRQKIPEMIKFIQEISKKYNLVVNIMGHIGDGNIHPHFCLDRRNKTLYQNFQEAKKELFYKAVELGGTLSGEHGIGCEKSEFMPNAVDEASINLMKNIKRIFDPKNILNPYKIF